MASYLYRYSPSQIPQSNSAYVGTLSNDDIVYLLPNVDVVTEATLIGQWDNDGTLVFIDTDVYVELRPFGNDVGIATAHLDLIHYQGHSQRVVQETPVVDTLPEYPADNQPFELRITRTLITDDAFPHIPWRWTVEMLSNDPLRDIIVRAIGIYNENDTYLGTTGSFVLMDFDEEDVDGNPIVIQRYGCECPAALWKADSEIIYFKLLYSGQPEGSWTLENLEEGATQTRLFWNGDQ